nr:immunoglobulin heavy chain junction region [Mus musculus]MBK4184729.1 immunoglobulin heavy chain junction region [Mus musculus]MBK4184730.1 immunoglobulin heavy chain junction region [Mus musculus]MBK4184744.1 immunoglobulin heavy chain junction region [Mus musculus]MBK4184745.1 immunoglobulin heavy chain junction region [Mus musculus]
CARGLLKGYYVMDYW